MRRSARAPLLYLCCLAYDRLNRPLTVDDEDAGTGADTTYTYSLTSPSWTDPTGTYLVTLDAQGV